MQVGRPAQQSIPSHHHKTQNYGSSYSNGGGAKTIATHKPSPSLTTIRTVEAGNFSEKSCMQLFSISTSIFSSSHKQNVFELLSHCANCPIIF